jgi:hypothetical protein
MIELLRLFFQSEAAYQIRDAVFHRETRITKWQW